MSVWGILKEAANHYRILFWRSLLVTFVVFIVLNLVMGATETAFDVEWAVFIAGILASLSVGFGDLVVEGALAHDGRDLHAGRRLQPFRTWERLRPILGVMLVASLAYAAASNSALFVLVVPAVIAPSNWTLLASLTVLVLIFELLVATFLSLIVPVIVLEGVGVRVGFRRSAQLVRRHFWKALVVVFILFVGEGLVESLCHDLFWWASEFWAKLAGALVASLIAVPYVAHALAAMYFELADVQRSGSRISG
jgi:hypothetical protein